MNEKLQANMEQRVMELVSDILEIQPLAVKRMTFGHNSIVYDVTLPDCNIIVRTNKNAYVFAKTEWNLTVLAQLGLPVPQVLASDITQQKYPFAYMILEKIPGYDLRYELVTMTHAQMTGVAEQVVFFQQKVATLPTGKGFGYVPIGEQGIFSSWKELLQYQMNKSVHITSNEVIGRWSTRLTHIFTRFEPYLTQVQPTCFLDDVTTKNVIVLNGELQGLVDFDCVCYGDPLWMIGLTQTAIVSDIGPQVLFYVEELCRIWGLTDEQRDVVNFYAVIHALEFMGRLMTKEDNTWVERMTRTIEQWITNLEKTKDVSQKKNIAI